MKKNVELLCMYVSFCSPQVPAWDFMWNFKPLFFLKQHTYPVHGLAEIVCEIECIYVYVFTNLF